MSDECDTLSRPWGDKLTRAEIRELGAVDVTSWRDMEAADVWACQNHDALEHGQLFVRVDGDVGVLHFQNLRAREAMLVGLRQPIMLQRAPRLRTLRIIMHPDPDVDKDERGTQTPRMTRTAIVAAGAPSTLCIADILKCAPGLVNLIVEAPWRYDGNGARRAIDVAGLGDALADHACLRTLALPVPSAPGAWKDLLAALRRSATLVAVAIDAGRDKDQAMVRRALVKLALDNDCMPRLTTLWVGASTPWTCPGASQAQDDDAFEEDDDMNIYKAMRARRLRACACRGTETRDGDDEAFAFDEHRPLYVPRDVAQRYFTHGVPRERVVTRSASAAKRVARA